MTHKIKLASERKPTIKVAVFGMDTRSIKMLSLIFQEKLNGLCEIVSSENAEIAIFDFDGKNGEQDWSDFQKNHKDLPAVVISMLPKEIENTIFVKKPIALPVLLNALNELVANKQQSKSAKKTPEKALSSKSNVTFTAANLDKHTDTAFSDILSQRADSVSSGLYFKPDEFALGHLQKLIKEAEAKNSAMKMICWGKKYIAFNPNNQGEILTDMNDSMLRNLAILKVGKDLVIETVTMDTNNYFSHAAADKTEVYSVSCIVWKLALLTARGRIPEGTNLDTPLFLQCWPGLTRLEPIENSFRMSALWVTQAHTINEISTTLDIPIDQVMNFYTACQSLGIAGVATRKSDNLVKPGEPQEHEKRGLFSSILQRFSNKAA